MSGLEASIIKRVGTINTVRNNNNRVLCYPPYVLADFVMYSLCFNLFSPTLTNPLPPSEPGNNMCSAICRQTYAT